MKYLIFFLSSILFAQISPTSASKVVALQTIQFNSKTPCSWTTTKGTINGNGLFQAPLAIPVIDSATIACGNYKAIVSFAVTPIKVGVVYQQSNGTLTILSPTNGIISNNPAGTIRTAINAGLVGVPGAIWVVNSSGQGQAVNCASCVIGPDANGILQLTFASPSPIISGIILPGQSGFGTSLFRTKK